MFLSWILLFSKNQQYYVLKTILSPKNMVSYRFKNLSIELWMDFNQGFTVLVT